MALRFRLIAASASVLIASLMLTGSPLRGDELPGDGSGGDESVPVCSTHGNVSCGCSIESCTTVNGETRCTLFCKFRYVYSA